MFNMKDMSVQEIIIDESIKELEVLNKKLAEMVLRKEELTNEIISALGHEHEGQKTYEHGLWRLEVKTPFNYTLNKKLYESGDIYLPEEFNPIKESRSFTIDKRLCDHYLNTAPESVRDTLIELIDKKPGKASINIKERI